MKPTLLILAAGMGSRYGGLKQMDGVGPSGETIIDYSIYDSIRAGFGKLVFVIRESFDADFRAMFTEKLGGMIEMEFVHQELAMIPDGFSIPAGREKPWGTAHAMLVAKDVIKEPFGVINADDYYGTGSYKLLADYLTSLQSKPANQHCLIGYGLSNTLSDHGAVSRGVCVVDESGFLTGIDERKGVERHESKVRYIDGESFGELTGDEVVSMNMWGFHHSIFEEITRTFDLFLETATAEQPDLKAECYIPDFIEQMTSANRGRVEVVASDDSWFGVTYKEDRPAVVISLKDLVEAGVYPQTLWS